MAANHLSTPVSELPEFIAKEAWNVSSIQTDSKSKGDNSIYKDDGSIKTGFIPNWKSLPYKTRMIVMDERERLVIKYKGEKRGKADHSRLHMKTNWASWRSRTKRIRDRSRPLKRKKSLRILPPTLKKLTPVINLGEKLQRRRRGWTLQMYDYLTTMWSCGDSWWQSSYCL